MPPNGRSPLIIPVEIQVRELDAKLLLACVAAHRGLSVVIGRIQTILANFPSYPRGVYLSKGMGAQSVEKFRFIRGLGHGITALDEEALVHYPAAIHFSKRVSPKAGGYISHLFAWGPENAALWRENPQFRGAQVHETGNPRSDLLRPEILPYYAEDSRKLRDRFGDFVLINTNFPTVNSSRGILEGSAGDGGSSDFGLGARGMPPEFARNLHRHRSESFRRFLHAIPEIERALPGVNVVVRPHPSEWLDPYHDLARDHARVWVENEGSAVPWMLAARATVQNGCTTGVESNLMGVPTLAFGPTVDEAYDFGRAFALPNLLSHTCPDTESLIETLSKILAGGLGCAEGEERDRLMAEFFAPRDGALASERIASILERYLNDEQALPGRSLAARLDARWRLRSVRVRGAATKQWKRLKQRRRPQPSSRRNSTFPDVPIEAIRERVGRFSQLLDFEDSLTIESLGRNVYRIER